MEVEIGDKVIWASDLSRPELEEGTVTKVQGDATCWIGEDCVYTDYLWPARVKLQLLEILEHRQQLLKAYTDSMSLIYELNNQISRGEI